MFRALPRFAALLLAFAAPGALPPSAGAQDAAAPKLPTRPPVNHRRNVEEFPTVEARFIRFTFQKTNGGQPCIDELEIYGPGAPARNLALAENGARASASGSLDEYRIHALRHINDGIYGNAHSWICNTIRDGWVEIELPAPTPINRIIWSRDREGKYQDRMATDYRVEAAPGPERQWQLVASSADRAPLSGMPSVSAALRSNASRFVPSAGEISGPTRPAAREYVLQTWQTAQGLPANAVSALVQARDGWLWIGTANGLARFDGARFTTFGESHGLPSLRITCLLEDAQGVLWVGTQHGGLARLENGRFVAVPLGQAGGENSIFSLARDSTGCLWIGAASGLYEMRGGQVLRRSSQPVLRVAAGPSHEGVWFLNNTVLNHWTSGKMDQPDPTIEPARFSSLGTLAVDAQGSLWFGGPNEYLARFADGKVTTFADGHPALTSVLWEILPTSRGDVWMGTSASGLARLRGTDVLSITTDDGLPANSVLAMCEDREGNLWVGTNGGGLTRVRERRIAALTMGDGLSQNSIMALAEDAAGTIWIGTNGGGLNRWAAGKVEPHNPNYLLENETIPALISFSDRSLWIGTWSVGMARLLDGKLGFVRYDLIPGRNITAFSGDAAENLWIGTLDGGPSYIAENGRVTIPALDPLTTQPITAIAPDPSAGPEALGAAATVWFATAAQGVFRFQAGKLSHFTPAEGLASNFVRTLRFDDSGTLWAGTSGGLSRWKNGRFESFTNLPDTVISQILDDGAGCLWLGTNRGIFRIPFASLDSVGAGRSASLDLLALDISDGLPSLECTGGYQPAGLRTRDGRLLFPTTAGLAIVDPKRFATPVAPPAVVIDEIAVGSMAYRTGAPAMDFHEKPGGSKLGTIWPGHPAKGPTHLLLVPDAGPLKVSFSAFSFTAPQRFRLRYRMDGLESAWNEFPPSAERTVTYAHLPIGKYQFLVEASQDGGPWSHAPVVPRDDGPWPGVTFTVTVSRPWWNYVAFAGGAVAALVVVAAVARFAARRRLKRRLREVEQKLALERERTRIARDIHDQLGANLTQIALLSAPQGASQSGLAVPAMSAATVTARADSNGHPAVHDPAVNPRPPIPGSPAFEARDPLLEQKNPEPETRTPDRETSQRFAAIAATANDLVQAVDAIVWAVNPQHGTLESLARYLVRFAEDFLARTPVRLRLAVPPQLPASPLSSEIRHNLFLAAREALNNAVRHAHATELHLSLAAENHHLTVTIADNGRGFDQAAAALGQGNGLENLHRRLADCGGVCTITSNPAPPTTGTTITFTPATK